MGETVASGVQNRRPMKKQETKWLKRVFDYLTSDSYMFAPLISLPAPVLEMEKPLKEGDRTLLEKVGEYLKSDNYMYAPLVIAQPMNVAAPKAIKCPQTGHIKSTTTEISARKITKKCSQSIKQPARGRTQRHSGMVNHMVHQNCRSSLLLGYSIDADSGVDHCYTVKGTLREPQFWNLNLEKGHCRVFNIHCSNDKNSWARGSDGSVFLKSELDCVQFDMSPWSSFTAFRLVDIGKTGP